MPKDGTKNAIDVRTPGSIMIGRPRLIERQQAGTDGHLAIRASRCEAAALRVYERVGMRAVRQSMNYEKEIRPGIDLATRELAA